MPPEGSHDDRQVGIGGDPLPRECRDKLPEEPGAPQAAAADDDSGAPGLGHHRQCVIGAEDVAVAQHWEAVEFFHEPADRRPISGAGVHLRGRAAVECDPGDTRIARGAPRIQIGEMVVVDSLAHLHCHGHTAISCCHGRVHDVGEEVALPRQRTASALARHFGHRTAEVEVHVVGHVFPDDDAHRLGDDRRVHPVELHRARRLIGIEAHHVECGLVTLDQRPGGHHLTHIEPRALLTAQAPEGPVGDPRHGRKHDGWIHRESAGDEGGHAAIVAPGS